jgi:4-hydroxybenzoate polyprenyltransferase
MGLLTFYAGSAAYAGPSGFYQGIALPIFAGAMSLWLGLVGMPTKDLSDVDGDRAAGRRSFAIVYGESVAWRVPAVTACGLAVAFCVAGAFLAPSLIWPATVMLGGALVIAAVCLSRASRGCRRRRRRPYRVFMATQFLAHFSVLPALCTHF